MAKETGLGFAVGVDDSGGTERDISNDVKTLSFGTPRTVIDVTGVDVSAMERLLGLGDFTVELGGAAFNDASNLSHDVFKTVPSTSVARTVSLEHSGQTLDNECLFSDYALERGDDGSLTWTSSGQLSDGTTPTWA